MFKIRSYIFLIIVIIKSHLSFSQSTSINSDTTTCNEVTLKGYLIREVKKQEMLDIARNKKLAMQGKTFETAIDYYRIDYFIPIDSIHKHQSLGYLLANNINFCDQRAVILPRQIFGNLIIRYCDFNRTINKKNHFFTKHYYEVVASGSKEKMLYKIEYVEGVAIKVKETNTYQNQRMLGLRFRVRKEYDPFDCFLVYNITKNEHIKINDELIKEYRFE